MPPLVAFDESGNTGQNLLDTRQPYYALASVCVPPEAAETLVEATKPPQLAELKFSRLRRSVRGRDAVLRVLTAGALTPATARVTPVHKPFMVVAKLVDDLIEPTFHARGISIYERGGHIVFSNHLFRRGPSACGSRRWHDLLEAFVSASREKTDEAVETFLAQLARVRIAASELYVRWLLDQIADGDRARELLQMTGDTVWLHSAHDPGPTCLFEHCGTWTQRVGRIRVIHDNTPVLERWLHEFQELTRPEARYASNPLPHWIPLPLRVDDFQVVASEDSPLVQLADVLAGACLAWIANSIAPRSDVEFASALSETVLPDLVENELWPYA